MTTILNSGRNARKLFRQKVRRTTKENVAIWVAFVIFCVYAFTLVYPFWWLFINSLKRNLEIRLATFALPKVWQWGNYRAVFEEFNFAEMFFNSVTLTVGLTFFTMVLSCMAAYVTAQYKFKGNEFIYTVVVISGTIPTVGALPATYRLMSDTKLIDTYLGMILLQCGGFGGVFLYLHSYFKAVPWSYAESAMLDGASDFRIFVSIMSPLVKNGIMAMTIIKVLGFWNDYWMPYMFYSEHPTVAVGLSTLSAEASSTGAYAQLFAAMIVSVLPVLIFYAIFQKQLMANTIGGGMKE